MKRFFGEGGNIELAQNLQVISQIERDVGEVLAYLV